MRPDMLSGGVRPKPPRRRRGRILQTVLARAKLGLRPALLVERRDALQWLSDVQELKLLLGALSVRDQRIVAALMIAVLDIFHTQGEAAAQAALDKIDESLRCRKRGYRKMVN
jgi:hypothetical protein